MGLPNHSVTWVFLEIPKIWHVFFCWKQNSLVHITICNLKTNTENLNLFKQNTINELVKLKRNLLQKQVGKVHLERYTFPKLKKEIHSKN